MRGRALIILLGIVLILNFVSADFEIGNLSHAITNQYSSEENIRGWINISLSDEPVDSLFEDSFGNSLSLIDLLKANPTATYTCNTGDCQPNYEASNPASTKTFNLNAGMKKTFGFQVTGSIANIKSVTFNVESDADESCVNQLEIDFLKNGNVEFGNYKSSDLYCLKNYGCFIPGETTYPAKIDAPSHCQKVTLSESPGFQIGAWVKEEVAGDIELSMTLYSLNRNPLASCVLPVASSLGREIGCEVNYSTVESGEYYLCLFVSDGSEGEYFTRAYEDISEGCGYKGYSSSTNVPENYAYQIFAKGKKFDAIGTLEISNILSGGGTISGMANVYIEDRYEDGCADGCVVPIEFISKMNQNLTLKNLSVNYDVGGVITPIADKFYDLSETPAVVNSAFQKINLDKGNFSVPLDYGKHTFEFDLDNEEIFSQMVLVKSALLINEIKPRNTASAIPTEFEILGDFFNITKYEWNFGDGTNSTTSVNKVTHTYNEKGMYELEITMTDISQLETSKTFEINVISPKQLINTTLKKKSDDLNKINAQMKQFKFEQNLKSVLDFDTLESGLNKVQQDYKKASSESDYKKIIINLLGIEVPRSIDVVENAELITFYPQKKNVNLNIMKEISGGNYETEFEDKYIDALLSWNQENMNTKVTFNEFFASYGSFDGESILRTFEFKIDKKNTLDKSYLVVAKIDGLEFEGSSSVKEKSGYLYIELEQDSEIIIFTTTEDVNFVDVPVFISPELSKLKIIPNLEIGETDGGFKWVLYSFILFLIILIGTGIYVILQEWYKRKYEGYLFKKRNDLYNLMIYITEEKKKEASEKEIASKLRKSGWDSEQVNYVMRKHAGRRTGMFEIIALGKKKEMQYKSRFPTQEGKIPHNQKFNKLK